MTMRRTDSIPLWLLFGAGLGGLFVAIPLLGLLTRVQWSSLLSTLTSPEARDALKLSLTTATIATLLATVLGVPLAYFLARLHGRLATVLRGIVLIPLVLPPVVSGIALLYAWGRMGIAGRVLAIFDYRLPFTTAAVVVAQTFVSLPFLVLALEGAFRTHGDRFDLISRSLGASPSFTFRTITLPLVLPSLLVGLLLAFSRALGEFGATLTFAGSLQGITRTLPLQIYLARESDVAAAVALSLLLVLLAFILALFTYRPTVEK